MNRPHAWMPVSPCGQGCLPSAGAVPPVTRLSWLLRLLAAAATLLAGLMLLAVLPLLGPADRERTMRAWYRLLLRALRVQLEVTGGEAFAAPAAGVLVVSNHMSWLDLVALCAVQPLRMVAKSDVRCWPVISLLARRVGTIFVDRERLTTLPRTIEAASGVLAQGGAVGAFPEGTTWCGLSSGRFRPAIFQAAVDTKTPVRPVALRYRLAGGGITTVASFVGPATLWESTLRVAEVRGLVVEVHLLPPLPVTGTDRRTLALRAVAAVTATSISPPAAPNRVLGTDCSNS
jgi:1-acyl-sn-glycerol-3-phosphate acyltransferase